MADFSSEGLSQSNAEQSTFQPKYQHQNELYVITVELSDWIYPNATQEPPIEEPEAISEIHTELVIQESIQPETDPKPAAPPKEIAPQKIASPTKPANSARNQKGTGLGNRNVIGSGTGKNAIDGPAGFANGNSEQTILRNIQRCYPLISRRRGEQGLAIVRIYVDHNGNSIKTEIIQSTNFSRLDKCALESVKSLKVKSKISNGQKTSSYFDQPIRFRLN
ncbi:energy transducer TonB [Wohlfahrtiimonas larvae]|uniref:TonB C-terminal domain-containing protein n=1 Tax=Wohlfahrtiimonas larvae TaxID=1157986 RepID=A0ABP9ML51_9GAMM|nr:energy transducer TonB [Wohlfahrtiimonas larvae]